MNHLPFDIFVELSKYIQVADLATLAKSCKHINTISKLEPVWKQQCFRVVSDTPPDYFETVKRINLVPIYRGTCHQRQLNLAPLAYAKRTDLNNDNLLFATRILSDSFLIVVNNRFEYQWTICIVKDTKCTHRKIYHCKSKRIENCLSSDRRLDSQMLSIIWLDKGSCLDYEVFLKELNKYVTNEIKHPLHAHLGSKFEKFIKFVNTCGKSTFPECQGLTILSAVNVTYPTNPTFKTKLFNLTKKAHGIIFCNEFKYDFELYFQVVYITPQNEVKFSIYKSDPIRKIQEFYRYVSRDSLLGSHQDIIVKLPDQSKGKFVYS